MYEFRWILVDQEIEEPFLYYAVVSVGYFYGYPKIYFTSFLVSNNDFFINRISMKISNYGWSMLSW